MALWGVRLTLLAILAVHLGLSIRLAVHNRRARPAGYVVREYRRATLASRTMALTGSLLVLFVVFHLLHLTAGVVDPAAHNRLDIRGQRDVFGNVVHAFQNPLLVVIYLVGQAVLGLHLSHALSSSLQTLGMEHPMLDRLFRGAGPLIAMLVALNILRLGWHVVRDSLGGLMDEALPAADLERIESIVRCEMAGALQAHQVRTRRAGPRRFVEFHLVVPGAMRVDDAHAICDRLEDAIEDALPGTEVVIHVEPDTHLQDAAPGGRVDRGA